MAPDRLPSRPTRTRVSTYREEIGRAVGGRRFDRVVTDDADTFIPIGTEDPFECRMTRSSYACDGCRTTIETVEDMRKVQGTVSSQWRCGVCGTTVPSVVAEKIKHQRQ